MMMMISSQYLVLTLLLVSTRTSTAASNLLSICISPADSTLNKLLTP